LITVKGFFSPDVEEVYNRAHRLGEDSDHPGQRFAVSWGLWCVNHHQSRLQEARGLSDELIRLATSSRDRGLLLQAHHSAWTTLFGLGDDKAALQHAEEGARYYDPAEHRGHAARYGGHDPGVCARMMGGFAAWFLGYPDRAGRMSAEAIVLGSTLGDPFSWAMALSIGASVAKMRREPHLVEERCGNLQLLLDQHQLGLGHFRSTAKMLQGWAVAAGGQADEGRRLADEGLAETRHSGFRRLSFQLGLTAELHRLVGEYESALAFLEEGLRLSEETGERRWQSLLLHEKGLTLAATKELLMAEEMFERALLSARQQQARSVELRVATSLAHLIAAQGRREEAQAALAPIYDWFAEGFDTADLMESKALLNVLA